MKAHRLEKATRHWEPLCPKPSVHVRGMARSEVGSKLQMW